MALSKSIRQPDGVTTNYHRIMALDITTNRQNSIVVFSYVDEQARIDETSNDVTPYRKSKTYETDYCQSMTIDLAYEYLKTLPEFKDAKDC